MNLEIYAYGDEAVSNEETEEIFQPDVHHSFYYGHYLDFRDLWHLDLVCAVASEMRIDLVHLSGRN